MKRREFLRGSAAGVLGGLGLTLAACAGGPPSTQQAPPTAATGGDAPTAAAPAPTAAEAAAQPTAPQAQAPAQGSSMPAIEWEMATSWPASLDTIYGGAVVTAERVAAMTNNMFQITPRVAGDLAPATQVLDVVSQGAVAAGHTASYYYIGKSPVTAFGTAVPFGFTAQHQNAWLFEAGGLAQLQEIYGRLFNTIQFPAGNTGTQMGGWFRREINTVADLNGLKMRIPGLGGQVMTALGVTVQVLGAGEIFQALQTGAVDAAEFVGPYDDEKLGFNQVADFYYFPGWWEPGPSLEVQVNLDEWNKLPKEYQEILKTACHEANTIMLSRYDARNNEALGRLIEGGTQVKAYSPEILAAAEEASNQIYADFASNDQDFAAVYEGWQTFRDRIYRWIKLNQFAFEQYIYEKVQTTAVRKTKNGLA
jgi:TRAP-type mannitol/chloroaromatic compound transport system substrate-binding protein